MEKEQVKQFDLEAAFKALDELEIPVVEGGVKANKVDLKERFSAKSAHEVLIEDYYDVNDMGDLQEAKDERDAEVAQAKLARIEKIVDLDADTADDLLPSYVGKVIIQCPQCMTLFYKNPEDIEHSEENPDVVNINEICQHCGNSSGYTLIGKVGAVSEEEADQYQAEEAPAEENELDLDFEEPTEEVDAEGTGEGAEEMSNDDLDLDLEAMPEEEVKEESLDSNGNQVLTEDVDDEPADDVVEEEPVEDAPVIPENSEEVSFTTEEVKEVATDVAQALATPVEDEEEAEEQAEEIAEVVDEKVDDAVEAKVEEANEGEANEGEAEDAVPVEEPTDEVEIVEEGLKLDEEGNAKWQALSDEPKGRYGLVKGNKDFKPTNKYNFYAMNKAGKVVASKSFENKNGPIADVKVARDELLNSSDNIADVYVSRIYKDLKKGEDLEVELDSYTVSKNVDEGYKGTPAERTTHLEYTDDNPADGKAVLPNNIEKQLTENIKDDADAHRPCWSIEFVGAEEGKFFDSEEEARAAFKALRIPEDIPANTGDVILWYLNPDKNNYNADVVLDYIRNPLNKSKEELAALGILENLTEGRYSTINPKSNPKEIVKPGSPKMTKCFALKTAKGDVTDYVYKTKEEAEKEAKRLNATVVETECPVEWLDEGRYGKAVLPDNIEKQLTEARANLKLKEAKMHKYKITCTTLCFPEPTESVIEAHSKKEAKEILEAGIAEMEVDEEVLDKLGIDEDELDKIISIEDVTNESLTEEVDKDLDKKLKAHNDYIAYLQQMIKQEEEALKKATNEEIKAAIQRRLDSFNDDLKAALPDAVKEDSSDLPTPEELGVEDVEESLSEDWKIGNPDATSQKTMVNFVANAVKNKFGSEDGEIGWATNYGGVGIMFHADKVNEEELKKVATKGLTDNQYNPTKVEIIVSKTDPNIKTLILKDISPLQAQTATESLTEGVEEEAKINAYLDNLGESAELKEDADNISALLDNYINSLGESCEGGNCKKVNEAANADDFEVSDAEFRKLINSPTFNEGFELKEDIDAPNDSLVKSTVERIKMAGVDDEVEEDLKECGDKCEDDLKPAEDARFKTVHMEDDVENLDESSFNEHVTNYLKEVYSNVKCFEATGCAFKEGKLIVEGKISFNSGKEKLTVFEFLPAYGEGSLFCEGYNKDFSEDKAFTLNYVVESDHSLVTQSFGYKYKINEQLVEGLR